MPKVPYLREELIERVHSGLMTADEAEAEATRLGLGLLEARPDPLKYDPMREPFWTLPMTAAWIAYRTEDAVREWSADYRAECTHWLYRKEWQTAGASGFRLVPWSVASLLSLRLAEHLIDRTDRDLSYSMPVGEAIKTLIVALRTSRFEATGIASGSGNREPISGWEWREMAIGEFDHEVDRLRDRYGRSYRDILIPIQSIRSSWPPRPPATESMLLPPLMKPEGGGYMPLYSAAQWIATEGGKVGFDPLETERWEAAYGALLPRIASEEVRVIGMRDGMPEPVPGYYFASVKVSYPFTKMPLGMSVECEVYLRSYPYTGQADWERGFDDSLGNHSGPKWSRLMAMRSDIAELWPFQEEEEDPNASGAALFRSGAPGRPSARHLVEMEFYRRCREGVVATRIGEEAKILAAWLKCTHPSAPSLTAKTIKNALGHAFRQNLSAQK